MRVPRFRDADDGTMVGPPPVKPSVYDMVYTIAALCDELADLRDQARVTDALEAVRVSRLKEEHTDTGDVLFAVGRLIERAWDRSQWAKISESLMR